MAARFICKFPRKYGSRFRVPVDERLDVSLVCPLRSGVGVECGGVAAKCDRVGVYSTVIPPVVDEIEDEFNAMFFGSVDNIVEALEAIGAIVDVTTG